MMLLVTRIDSTLVLYRAAEGIEGAIYKALYTVDIAEVFNGVSIEPHPLVV